MLNALRCGNAELIVKYSDLRVLDVEKRLLQLGTIILSSVQKEEDQYFSEKQMLLTCHGEEFFKDINKREDMKKLIEQNSTDIQLERLLFIWNNLIQYWRNDMIYECPIKIISMTGRYWMSPKRALELNIFFNP
jgi:hypothetical protein